MLKIFLYLIEGFIIGYFDFKFIKKDFNYYLISFFSIIFSIDILSNMQITIPINVEINRFIVLLILLSNPFIK